jgi:hypothetical protein
LKIYVAKRNETPTTHAKILTVRDHNQPRAARQTQLPEIAKVLILLGYL